MSGRGILKYFRPITHKMYASEDKDPPQGNELPNAIYLGHIYRKLYHRHRDQLIATCNTDVTRVLKQAKCSFIKNC